MSLPCSAIDAAGLTDDLPISAGGRLLAARQLHARRLLAMARYGLDVETVYSDHFTRSLQQLGGSSGFTVEWVNASSSDTSITTAEGSSDAPSSGLGRLLAASPSRIPRAIPSASRTPTPSRAANITPTPTRSPCIGNICASASTSSNPIAELFSSVAEVAFAKLKAYIRGLIEDGTAVSEGEVPCRFVCLLCAFVFY